MSIGLTVHPAAEVFPMLNDDELNELAADIKANGLLNPIVCKDGVLIDGRNRLEACRRAGVEPRYTELNGVDPIAFILSSNIARRHMMKGQRAMAVAMIYPEAERGRGKIDPAQKGAESASLSYRRIQEARTVLKWAPELADGVLSGAQSLDAAYDVAVERKTKAEAPVLRLNALRTRDPDLADKVVEQHLSLDDAEGAARDRRERERVQRQGKYEALAAIERYLFVFQEPAHRAELVRIVREHPTEISRDDLLRNIDAWCEALQQTIKELNDEQEKGA